MAITANSVDSGQSLIYPLTMENAAQVQQQIVAVSDSASVWGSIGWLIILAFVAYAANYVVKKYLLRLLHHLVKYTRYGKDEDVMKHEVISKLSNAVPAFVFKSGIELIPNIPQPLTEVVRNVAAAFIILTLALALSEFLNVVNTLYKRHPDAHNKPIKGYLQVLKIVIAFVTIILVVSTLIDRSPIILLSGLGALAAVMMLVFQDTLLSLVASVQISSADMVRVGDWIEMPQLNADGDVIDIALHTVKVQNWDKTITTIPTRRLVSDPFKNWRGMRESGGRRIKRAIYIDQNSIHFLTDQEKKKLSRFCLLTEYLEKKEKELEEWNKKFDDDDRSDPFNSRQLTNIGTFRAYVHQYLRDHDQVNQKMLSLVRQLSPGASGLPIEIYCFTKSTAWVAYEGVQSDIFDHLYAILPKFGLRAFQQPSGHDLVDLQRALEAGHKRHPG